MLLLTLDICLIIMALKMLPLQLSNQASCLSCHAIEDVAAADAEASAPSYPIVADVIAVYVEPRVLPQNICWTKSIQKEEKKLL